jgi:hypothetical protein
MSVLLYVASAVVVMAGAAMVGFGVPINEFSFGNTLIIAGTTTMVGGLIIFGLGAAVAQLQRVADGLAARPLRPGEPVDIHESPPPEQLPFPPKHEEEHEPPPLAAERAEPLKASVEPPPAPIHEEPRAARPELPPFPPRRRPAAPPVPPPPPLFGGASAPETHEELGNARWRRPPPPPPPEPPKPANFEDMWPAKEMAPSPKPPFGTEPEPEIRAEAAISEPAAPEPPPPPPMREPPPARETMPFPRREPPSLRETVPPPLREVSPPPAREVVPPMPEPETTMAAEAPRAVAILKSGVVDGMGYTLYVDGSIEAELPQGTLRFASINELREHLEKSS